MAQLTYFQAVDMTAAPTWTGDFVVAQSNYFGLQGASNAGVYLGSFNYGSDGIASGIVNGYDLFKGSSLEVQVRGVSFDAALVQQALIQGNHALLQRSALLGNDLVRGSSADDRLIGEGGNDLIYGMSGSDILIGGDGNDTLIGGPGNDTISGGAGLDFAVYSATRNQYQLSINDDGLLEVADAIAVSRDGIDVLQEVERIRFYDVDLALDTNGAAGQAYRIYKAAFNRQPDADGLGFWIANLDAGVSLTEAAQGFLASDEFQRLYGSNPTNEQFVQLLYQNVLGREPEASGFEGWVRDLEAGASRADVLVGFSESEENRNAVAGEIAGGILYFPDFIA